MNDYLCCDEIVIDGDEFWFSAYSHNGLYRGNMKSGKIQLVSRFPGEKGIAFRLYKAVIRMENYLVFAPCAANEIAVFDIRHNQMKKMPLREMPEKYEAGYNGDFKFWAAIADQDSVYLLGLYYPAIIRVNPFTEEIEYYTEWIGKIDNYDGGYLSDGIIRGRYAYLSCFCISAVLKINLDSYATELVAIKSRCQGFFGLSDDGNDLWFTPRKNQPVVKWNPDSGEMKEIDIPYIDDIVYPFYKPLVYRDYIYLFPLAVKNFYTIDRKTEILKKHEELSDAVDVKKKEYVSGFETVLNPMVTGEYLLYISGKDYSWNTYQTETGIKPVRYLRCVGESRRHLAQLFMENEISKGNILIEHNDMDLCAFLECLNHKNQNKKMSEDKVTFGKNIHEVITGGTNYNGSVF